MGHAYDAQWQIMAPKGDVPSPRCGHTLSFLGGRTPEDCGTMVLAFGETAKLNIVEERCVLESFAFYLPVSHLRLVYVLISDIIIEMHIASMVTTG